jgi:hypothetical protein
VTRDPAPHFVMRFSIMACGLALIAGIASADELLAGEYFIDTDPGYGSATAIPGVGTPSYSGALTLTPEVLASLTGPTHLLGIRFQDTDGTWGATKMKIFSPMSADSALLARGEYFLNEDPGEGMGVAITAEEAAEFSAPITLSPEVLNTLPRRPNLIGIRFQDANVDWGETKMRYFSPMSADSAVLARGEYFLNEDPGEGMGVAITTEEAADYSAPLTLAPGILNTLPSGVNLMGVRFRDTNGDWGETAFRLLDPDMADDAMLSKGEYFINNDPGLGLATAISLTGEVSLSPEFLQTLPTGMNLLGVRFQDSEGEWSRSSFRLFDNISDEAHDLSEVSWKLVKGGTILKSGTLLPNRGNRLDLIVRERTLNISEGDLLVLELQAFDSKGNGGSKFHKHITVGSMHLDFLNQYFTTEEQANAAISGDLADPDGDGLANLLEEALGLNPRKGSPPVGALALAEGGNSFSFSSHVALEFDEANSLFTLGSLTYQLSLSSDLENWTAAQYPADFSLPATPTEEEGRFLQEIVLPEGLDIEKYYRLHILRGE